MWMATRKSNTERKTCHSLTTFEVYPLFRIGACLSPSLLIHSAWGELCRLTRSRRDAPTGGFPACADLHESKPGAFRALPWRLHFDSLELGGAHRSEPADLGGHEIPERANEGESRSNDEENLWN